MRCNLFFYQFQSDLQPTGNCNYRRLRDEVPREGIIPKIVWQGHARLARLMYHTDNLNDYTYFLYSLFIYMWLTLITYIFLTVWTLMITRRDVIIHVFQVIKFHIKLLFENEKHITYKSFHTHMILLHQL